MLVAVAFAVGALVGLTGVGAGAIMTPVLVGFFGVSLPVAIATDLIFATVTKLVGVPFHHRDESINWSLARRMWVGSIPGALFGVIVVLLGVSRAQTDWLVWPLVFVILLTSLTLAGRALERTVFNFGGAREHQPWRALPQIGGFGIGGAVSITSVGAGALGMALLVFLSPAGVRPRELVGTDLVHAIPIAVIGGAAYAFAGLVSFELLTWMLVGSLPGVIVASVLIGRVSGRIVSGILSVVLLAASLLLVAGAIG